jgi:hypothetical protein
MNSPRSAATPRPLSLHSLQRLALASLLTLPLSAISLPRPAAAQAEDCISFAPNNTRVQRVNGSWKIVEGGNHWMFDFGNKQAEARQTMQIIKKYGLNKSCFVGRPDPSFTYMLRDDSLPVGKMRSEDCVTFNPATVAVSLVQNRWKIVDGNHWVFDFNTNEAEAKQSFEIIKKYNATHSCYVGRPGASFTYLRR